MPEVQLQFRASCGSFFNVYLNFMAKRARERVAMRTRTATVKSRSVGVLFGILLTLLFFGDLLHRSGDVEKNPGPKGMKQTRLTSSSDNDKADTLTQENTCEEPSMRDLMTTLLNLNIKFDAMKEEITGVKDVFQNLQTEIREMRSEINDLKQENKDLKKENEVLRKDMELLQRRTDDLEDRSRRSNIIIHGLPRDENEKSSDCENIVKTFLSERLKIADEISFDRVHRLTGKKNSPMIAKCTFFKDKDKIMKEKGQLKGSTFFVGEDFSRRVRDVRKRLVPHLKKAKSEGKRATMVYDHLLIDGTKFDIDADDTLVKSR